MYVYLYPDAPNILTSDPLAKAIDQLQLRILSRSTLSKIYSTKLNTNICFSKCRYYILKKIMKTSYNSYASFIVKYTAKNFSNR